MSETKLTPEQEAKKAKKAERKEAKNKAYDVLFKLVEASKNEDGKKALMTLRPSLYGIKVGGGGGGSAAFNAFLNRFDKVGAKVKEAVIFEETGEGRKACAGHIKNGLKKVESKDRKWIRFNLDSRDYELLAIGEKAPNGWTGYTPTAIDVEDLK